MFLKIDAFVAGAPPAAPAVFFFDVLPAGELFQTRNSLRTAAAEFSFGAAEKTFCKACFRSYDRNRLKISRLALRVPV